MSDQDDGQPGRKPWFKPKRFGYGRSPATWQGWLVLAVVVAVLVALRLLIVRSTTAWIIILAVVACGSMLLPRSGRRNR